MWDPQQYLRHAGPRLRPLHDLLAHVPEALPPGRDGPPRIADLGCGPGGPTTHLADRWPTAHLTGYDSDPAMLDAARAHARDGAPDTAGRLDFAHADLADWRPGRDERFGLLFSNAALQWVPGHQHAFPDWIADLPSGGVLAFQVPGNFTAPSHTLLAALRNSPRWRDRLGAPSRADDVLDPAGYAAVLTPLGCTVDTWETTYLHRLTGPDPVLEWTKGTALRPVLTLLADDPQSRTAFLDEYATALRAAYPPTTEGTDTVTYFPFRRVFVIAVKH